MDDYKKNRSDSDFEVTGVSRSGRVRKKSSKLMDFESPDDIDSKPRKLPPQRLTVTPQSSHRNYVHDPDPDPDPDSDVDVQNDAKSDVEEMEGGSSDSDYYDPAQDNQDSMDSIDSEDNALSDIENNFNSSSEQRNKHISRPANSLYLMERSNKRKPITDIRDKFKNQRTDRGGTSKSISHPQNNFNSSSIRPRSSSRNRHPSNKSSPICNSLTTALGGSIQNSASGMYIEVGAHLRLLGESLAIIGERLKEHEGQIAVSGSVSVLLDTLLCSLAPLICLTAHLPSISPPLTLLHNTLDNIAYIMPGL